MTDAHSALITNDAVVLGLLAVILGFIFKTSHSNNAACQKFYKYVPALLLCYFLPSLLNTFGIVDGTLQMFILWHHVIYCQLA